MLRFGAKIEIMGNVLLCLLIEREGKRICELCSTVFCLKHDVEKDSCLPHSTLLVFLLTFYYHKIVHGTGGRAACIFQPGKGQNYQKAFKTPSSHKQMPCSSLPSSGQG